jgi:pectinesterase
MEIKELFVSKGGVDGFDNIGDALVAAKEFDGMEVVINIAPGTYNEKLVVSQDHISFVGTDEKNTRIGYGDGAFEILSDGIKRGTFRTQSILLDGDFFHAKNITFYNSAGQGTEFGQAIAMYGDGDQLIFENCRFESYQDTIFIAPLPKKEIQPGGFRGPKEFAPRRLSRQLYKDCYIVGNVDFIFGSGIAYFENCEIAMVNRDRDVAGYVTAPSTYEGQKYGFVFNHCNFTNIDCPPRSAYLGRPWRDYAKSVILNSKIDNHIKTEGWFDWNKKDAWDKMFFAEYGNYGEGACNLLAGEKRAPYVHMLTKEEADEYTRENVLGF